MKKKLRYKFLNKYWTIYKPHFKYSYKNKCVLEHRYIYHIYLSIKYNRIIYLPTKNYEINHIDGNGFDNRIENLELISRNKHNKIHKLNPGPRICNLCKSKKTRIKKGNIKNWYLDINGFLCFNCYRHIMYIRTKFNL